jgi:hypothetical protein
MTTATKKRSSRQVETMEYLQTVVRRTIVAAGKRVADADEPELQELLALRATLDEAIAVAIDGQRKGPAKRSWAQIAAATGTTRQGAFQRWGRTA